MSGLHAFVTGGAGALGRATATHLVQLGYTVHLADIDEAAVTRVAEEFAATGGRVHAYVCDVSDPESVNDAAQAVVHQVSVDAGTIDLVVNNAGTTHVDDLLNVTFKTWRRVMSVNADGVFLVGQAFSRLMVSQPVNPVTGRRGMVVNVGSVAAEVGRPPRAAYGASKALVKHLTMTQALALAEHQVAACLLVPGEVIDGMLTDIYERTAAVAGRDVGDLIREAEMQLPRQQFQTPDEIGQRIAFLASSPGMTLNGTTLWCDSRLTSF
ncbi:3-oxoacyl-ACP reductase FabG [Nocardioides bigeumensis]|uniref:3-oxoacyl-ACP reductase FabG n=1 Tax=Nocardioides bigeumensis TaxID=433657 RepID=A0ABN2YWM9_9ACTN